MKRLWPCLAVLLSASCTGEILSPLDGEGGFASIGATTGAVTTSSGSGGSSSVVSSGSATSSVSASASTGQTGSSSTGAGGGGIAVGQLVPDFSLIDENPNSSSFGQAVSPRDHLERVSGWYFGHAT